MSDDEVVVVCSLVTAPPPIVTLGSVKRRCDDCGREIWAARSSIELEADYGALLVCRDCGGHRWTADPDPRVFTTRSQVLELDSYRRRS